MSRAEHSTTTRRRVLAKVVPSALGVGLAAVLVAGCGAGQIAQTDTQESAVNGANGMIGAIAIRNAQLAFPGNPQGVFQPGSTARLIVTIVNTGLSDDTLTKLSSPAATSVRIDGSTSGGKLIPGNFAVASGQDVDDESASAAPSDSPAAPTTTTTTVQPTTTPAGGTTTATTTLTTTVPTTTRTPRTQPARGSQLPGTVTIDLIGIRTLNGAPLRAGLTIPITFYFQHAGQVTLPQVPIGAPTDNSSS